MNNNLLQLKIKQRLNKLSSNDYDSFECWMIVEAFNKVQNEWVRAEIEKGEDSTQGVDNLSPIVKEFDLVGVNKSGYYESEAIPADYYAGKRVSAKGVTKDCLEGRRFKIYDGEESNLDNLLADANRCPSFEWAETFKTQIGNRIRIHTDGKFEIIEPKLIYYRKPRQIAIEGCVNEFDVVTTEVTCEFKDDITEMLIDSTASVLAGDTESFNQMQRLRQTQTTKQ